MSIRTFSKIKDIANIAGVSTATVDRVLNKRDGVRPATADQVWNAVKSLEKNHLNFANDPNNKELKLGLMYPDNFGSGSEAIKKRLYKTAPSNLSLEILFFHAEDPYSQAEAIENAMAMDLDALAIHSLNHPSINEAIATATTKGLPIMSFLSTISDPNLFAHVGINNRSAGRTASYFMGNFIKDDNASFAVLSSGFAYGAHEEREIGFSVGLHENYHGNIDSIDLLRGRDDVNETYKITKKLLEKKPNLKGIYNTGSGNLGICKAIQEAKKDKEIRLIAHNLSDITKPNLIRGTIDLIISMEYDKIVEDLIYAFLYHRNNEIIKGSYSEYLSPFLIITKENYI